MAVDGRYISGKDVDNYEKILKKSAASGGLRTEIESGTEAPDVLMPGSPLKELENVGTKTAKTALDMQKKKEDRLEVKSTVNSAQIKRDRTKKEYDDYVNSQEYRQKRTADIIAQQIAKDRDESQSFASTSEMAPPIPQQDEKEMRLRAARDQAEKEYNEAEDKKRFEADMEVINGLSEEDRKRLEVYSASKYSDRELPEEYLVDSLLEDFGRERLDELERTYSRYKNAKRAEEVDAKAREFVSKRGGRGTLANILSVPVQAYSGIIGTGGQLAEMMIGTGGYKTQDPNAYGTIGQTLTGAIRGQTSENITEDLGDGFAGKAANLGYQGVMAAADSVAQAYLGGGGLGGATLAATNSFSQTMADASRKGATPAQAAMLATTTAGIEALTEKIPLDNLIRTAKGANAKSIIANALRQAGIEATTEEISLLGSVLAEAAILQEKSSYQQDVINGIMSGMSPDEAILQASKNILEEAKNTALVSMISGGASSLSASAADRMGMFAEEQANNNPELNRPKNAQEATQEAIANNQARRERLAAEETAQQPQTAQVQKPEQTPTQPQQQETPTQQPAQPKQSVSDTVAEVLTNLRETNGKATNKMTETVMSDPAAMQELGITPEAPMTEPQQNLKMAMEDLMGGQEQPIIVADMVQKNNQQKQEQETSIEVPSSETKEQKRYDWEDIFDEWEDDDEEGLWEYFQETKNIETPVQEQKKQDVFDVIADMVQENFAKQNEQEQAKPNVSDIVADMLRKSTEAQQQEQAIATQPATPQQTVPVQKPVQPAEIPGANTFIKKDEPPKGKKIYLEYQSISPASSFFHPKKPSNFKGSDELNFTVNADGTLDWDQSKIDESYNTVGGYISKGFGYLYDMYVDGKKVTDANSDTFSGYYDMKKADVQIKPVLREISGGNFILSQKGELNLYSDNFVKPTQTAQQPDVTAEQAQPVAPAQEAVQTQTEAPPVQQAPQQTQQPQTQQNGQQSLTDIYADMFTQMGENNSQNQQEQTGESVEYQDEFADWGADSNREGVENPMADRKYSEVSKRNVKAYMYENPAVKPFYQEEAAWMLSELSDSTKGERTYNEQLHYDSGGEKGWSGTKRHTSDSIAELLDQDGMTYEQIERGLNAIINDHGQENNAASKRIEFVINKRLMDGYTDFYTGKRVEGNAEYLNLLRNQQSTEQTQATSDRKQASAPTTDMQMGANDQSAEGGQIKGTGAAEANFSGKAAYQELLQEGNVQRDRPGDVRPVEVPKTDTQGRKVSETVGNFYGAAVTSDEMANRIEELVQDGALSYDTRTNKQSLENASAEITKNGEESVKAAIAKNVGQNKIQDGDIEKALLLYAKDANDPNRQEAAAEMMVQLQEMATMSGRNLQLFRLVRRMTPEGQLMATQKEIRANTEKMIKSGYVKKGFEPVVNTELEQEYMKAAKDAKNAKTDKARQEAEASMKELQDAMYLDAAAQMPSTFKAKWDAWRYMAMLGNVKTQVRNLAGNLAFKPYKEVKDKMGALAEKLFVPKDQRTKTLITDQTLAKWAREDAKTQSVNEALKYSAKLGDDVSTQKIRENMQVFNSKALDNVRKFVESVPQSGDMLFKNNYYSRSLAGFLKARGYTAADIQNNLVNETVLNEARFYAIQEAMKATFNDNNAFSDFLSTELRYKGENPMGKAFNMIAEGVLPFRRTPANIAVRFSEYSPVGVAKGLWDAATKVRKGEMTAATAIDQLTSGLTGSAVMALGFALAGGLNGIKITGSGTDEDEKRQGHQDYALEFSVDGQEYSYKIDWAAPANLPLFVGANIYKAIESAGEDTDVSKFTSFLRGMGNAFEPMLALSCLSGVNDLFESARYAEEGEALYTVASNIATGYFTQGIPALLRQASQASNEYKQTTFANSNDPTMRDLQTTAANIPFVGDKFKTDKVNEWGENESQGTAFERIVNSFLNPGTLKKIDTSAVEQEISRLNSAQDENVSPDYIPKVVSYTDKEGNFHKNYRLTEEQYQKFGQTQGQTARSILDTMVNSKNYQALTDEQKAAAMNMVYSYAKEKAMGETFGTTYGETWMMKLTKGREAEQIISRTADNAISNAFSKLDTAWDSGYSKENTAAYSRKLSEVYDSYSKMNPQQKQAIKASATGNAAKYIEAREKGISHDKFVNVAMNVNNIKGTGAVNKDTGKATVRDIDKRQAIAKTTGLNDREVDIIMRAYMADYDPNDESPETTEFKYQYAREELGLSAKEYAATYRAYLDNGRKAQKIAAIRALGYDYKTANALYKLYYGRMKDDLIEMYG